MIKDKVLIVHDYPIIKNEGGPRGYYNKCIHLNEPDNILSLNDALKKTKTISFKKRILIKVDFIRNKISKIKYRNRLLANKFIKIPKYKFLYFHDIYSFNDVKHLIKEDQIVVFQPHSPELISDEELKNGANQKKYKEILAVEKAIFKRANYIILPNENCISIYKSILSDKHKLLFLTTGIKPLKDFIKIPVDTSKINLFYIGRRNEIKGFDVLINSFKEAVKTREDIRLFIAGSGAVVRGKNIVDIGATSVAYDWIDAMDYVISPNKSSYFDLNVLEAIAIGTPLLMTTTEGHQFFEGKKGIISITDNNFKEILINEELVNKNLKLKVQKDLKDLYREELSNTVYKKNLEKLCNQLFLENN